VLITEQPLADGTTSVQALFDVIGPKRERRVCAAAAELVDTLAGRELWHVNSTARGGGVAELLARVLPIYRALGVPVRWAVIGGPEPFFKTTKALGLALYGDDSMLRVLDAAHQRLYAGHGHLLAEELLAWSGSSPAVILHDHQTACLAPTLHDHQAGPILWRCHVGADKPNRATSHGWAFIQQFLAHVDGRLFSIPGHVPAPVPGIRDFILPPVIDPAAPKHRDLGEQREALWAELTAAQQDGSDQLVRSTPGFSWCRPLSVQISRWDRLKDMHGVLGDFARSCPSGSLILAGPDPSSIGDDPDQPQWFHHAHVAWTHLTERLQHRIALVRLPMTDEKHNALLVNTLQRSADVVIQKSLAEGFGLTVTEAMWKGKPVVASGVGGLRAQIDDGATGLLAPPGASIGPGGAQNRHVRGIPTLSRRGRPSRSGGHRRSRGRASWTGRGPTGC
jgi:trehalose synthase